MDPPARKRKLDARRRHGPLSGDRLLTRHTKSIEVLSYDTHNTRKMRADGGKKAGDLSGGDILVIVRWMGGPPWNQNTFCTIWLALSRGVTEGASGNRGSP